MDGVMRWVGDGIPYDISVVFFERHPKCSNYYANNEEAVVVAAFVRGVLGTFS